MITAACAVVNGGRLMKPYLVEAIEDSDGNLLRQTSPQVAATPHFRPDQRDDAQALIRRCGETAAAKTRKRAAMPSAARRERRRFTRTEKSNRTCTSARSSGLPGGKPEGRAAGDGQRGEGQAGFRWDDSRAVCRARFLRRSCRCWALPRRTAARRPSADHAGCDGDGRARREGDSAWRRASTR